ncbi:anti-sigma factor domain-containing protein [Clostridium magnum]|uniref:Anti-sigma-I factor RsgI n=1 Tax=Clostridium magnum DSM 2767 TaxID=1121326 RepID=A0A162SGQ6_9CLOT|nr:anti-sigma factor domain-containing protein [Clostridium magnum]KZL91231.1 anti-sigma-I factor RsgI [Clostridium magnum DSM 2767]SHI33717.1 Anti-sigma factor N-terminus [Clostridium magnum DSM 2767]
MNSRSGIVMKIENSTLYLMTSDGEFVKVRLNKKESLPMIGSEYCGEIIKPSFIRSSIFKYASVASLVLFTLFGGGGAYAYYKPVSTITITINPSIELKSNMWGKVISTNPINEDGKKILEEVSLKNKTVDDALLLVLDQSKKDKFIDDNYVKNNKTVQISVKGKELSLSSFEKKISEDSLSVQIDNNGTIIYNKNLKNENSVSSDNKKEITNTTNEYNNNIDKNSNIDNIIDDNLPAKNEDKQKNQNTNKDSKVDYKNSDADNYDTNIKSDDTTIYKKHNKDYKNPTKSKNNKSSDNSKKNSDKNSNNGHTLENKNKKDK